ncbi:SDR family oxidoreductase (plasmid) [Roseobacteraceae bacterium NS-SX3]
MSRVLFMTGASGFIGRALLPHLQGWQLRLLVRDPGALPPLPAGAEVVQGDLEDPAAWQGALEGAEAVLHLAALTGKASAAEHARLNHAAAARLIAAAKAAGVPKFLFVSSIAAGYADKAFYPYARAKAAAERDLAASGLAYTILRPTLVLGQGAPLWESLSTLAGLPVIPLPRRGAEAEVQPVDVDDVCRAIALVLERDRFAGETLDVGGPERLAMGEFLQRIAAARGRQPRSLPLPLRLVQYPLALMEPLARPVMPATAGQFAVFGNDSAAQESWLSAALKPGMAPLEALIARLSRDGGGGPDGEGGAGEPPGPATAPQDARREAQALSRRMCGQDPPEAAVAHYLEALQARGLAGEGSRFDQLTLRMARRGGLALWLADGCAGFAHRRGTLRRRQVLLAAILENSPQTHRAFDEAAGGGPGAAVLRLALTGLGGGAAAVLGSLALLPLRVWHGAAPGGKDRG